MAGIKAVGLLAAVLAACPALAMAQKASESEQAAARLKEAGRLEDQGMTSARAGNYASAVIPFEAALMIREQTLGPDHADTVRSLDNLAMVDLALGRPADAEPLLERVLATRERALGPDHPDVADGLHNLANAYAASEDLRHVERSLPLFERAAAIRTGALGPDHPRVAEALNRMAVVDLFLAKRSSSWRMPDLLAGVRRGGAGPRLSREEHLDRARRGLERALAIRDKALGPDHPAVAASLRSLAAVHVERGHYTQAEPLMRRALAISEKALGPTHPATADFLDGYAQILGNVRTDAAAEAEVKALKTRARAIRDAQVRRASADAPPSIAPAR